MKTVKEFPGRLADKTKRIKIQIRLGRLAQLARALRLHRRCRGFESLIAHFYLLA